MSAAVAREGAPLLEARNLHGRYGEIAAIRGIELAIAPGEIVALLGANGSGKTSTLRALTGGMKTTGTVTFAGTALTGGPEDAARRGIAHVPEGRGTLSTLTVWENMTLGGYVRSAARARAAFDRIVTYFPWLADRKAQQAGTLSGGEQQMLAIARALMLEPKLLLLDEPSLGLAPMIVREIFALLRRINEENGVTILVAEQNATVALATADRAYVLEAGRIAMHGPSADLARNELVRRSYLGY